ncbi:MAG: peptidylprolyl isomerase [Alphaproteobacteria bacterium]|nr:peptidylprolyl isomerase [Alphaproteobacteria bacterium]
MRGLRQRQLRSAGWVKGAALGLAMAAAMPAAMAQQDLQRIAAVVNDDIISMFDLNARIQFGLVSSGAPDNPENRKRFQQQVLKGLIDERLQKQEANKQNIKVSEQEIKRALADIEKQNNMPVGGLDAYLAQNKVPRSTLVQQVEASIAWQRLISRRLRPKVEIGDDEIDETLKRMEESRGSAEMHVAEIFLAVDQPDQEDEVLRNMERLIEQLQRGARFSAIARQFSQNASAAAGGDLGWVQEGQLDEQIEQVLKQMPSGTISKPIRTIGGYHLLALIERRGPGGITEAPKLDLQQALLPVPRGAPAAEVEALKAQLAAAAKDAKDCKAFDSAVKQINRSRSISLGKVSMTELPPPLQTVVGPLNPGQTTPPLQPDPGTLMMLMVCDRQNPEPTPLPGREDIRERLTQQRLNLMSRRYLRDLRRAAFVDLRV